MSSMGVCSLCRKKCVAAWMTHPCKHEACRRCLMFRDNCTACFECRKKVEFFRCPGFQYGCHFNASQGTWKEHEVNCMFLPVECPYQCDAIIPKKTLSRHINSECPLRLATCRYCQDSVFQVELDCHERSCPEAPISCSFCHKENIKRGRLSDHAKTCQRTPKSCPLNEYGCSYVGLDSVMDEHLNVKNHVPCFQKLKKDLEERDAEVASLRDQLDTLKNEMREYSADGSVLFDKGLKWSVLIPDISNTRGSQNYPYNPYSSSSMEPRYLTSPVYKHCSTKTSFCFTLTFLWESLRVTLKQHVLASGGLSQFTVIVEKKPSESSAPTQIARKETVGCRNQEILSWRLDNTRQDTFYVVTCVLNDSNS